MKSVGQAAAKLRPARKVLATTPAATRAMFLNSSRRGVGRARARDSSSKALDDVKRLTAYSSSCQVFVTEKLDLTNSRI